MISVRATKKDALDMVAKNEMTAFGAIMRCQLASCLPSSYMRTPITAAMQAKLNAIAAISQSLYEFSRLEHSRQGGHSQQRPRAKL